MAYGFSDLVDDLVARVRQRGTAAPPQMNPKAALASLATMAKALEEGLDDRKKILADLNAIKVPSVAADRASARQAVHETMKRADAAFAAGEIDQLQLGQLDWHARRLLETLAGSP